MPAFSAIFIMPNHKHMTPISFNDNSTAPSAALIALCVTISMRPWKPAYKMPLTINSNQIKLINILITSYDESMKHRLSLELSLVRILITILSILFLGKVPNEKCKKAPY
jgi:hypothetical protein